MIFSILIIDVFQKNMRKIWLVVLIFFYVCRSIKESGGSLKVYLKCNKFKINMLRCCMFFILKNMHFKFILSCQQLNLFRRYYLISIDCRLNNRMSPCSLIIKFNFKLFIMKNKNKFQEWMKTASLFAVFILLSLGNLTAQCINNSSYGGGILDNTMTTPTTYSNGNWATEYAPTTVADAGQYEIGSTVASDYLTVTDDLNNVITHGAQPVTVTFATAGSYRVHITTDAACNTNTNSRNLTAEFLSPPGCIMTSPFASATLSSTSTSPVNITTCQYASEYATLTIQDAGQYEFTSSVATDYITFTDNNDNIIAAGITPLQVNVSSTGTYRTHYAADVSCNTDNSCRTTTGEFLGGQSVPCLYPAPFSEDFNSGSLPTCWTNTSSNSGSANGLWKFSGSAAYGAGSNGKSAGTYAWTDGSTPAVNDVTLITPLIDVTTLTTPMLSFEWFSNNTNNPGDNTTLYIEVNNGSGWTNVATLAGDDPNWVQEDIILTAYANDTIEIRFINDQTTTSSSAFYNDILLDDVSVVEAPTCLPVDSLLTTNATSNSVDVSWVDPGTGQNWIVEHGPAGFTPGTGTAAIVTGTPYTVTNLSQGTVYDFYVRSDCGGGDSSTYTGPITDTTSCGGGLAGTYTIDGSQPTGGTNFNSFNDIIQEMMLCGISGAVHVDVQSGTYNEQVYVGTIPGASATNTVTFKGVDPATSILTFEQNVSADRYTLRMENTSYLTFDSLTIEAQSSGTYGWIAHIMENTTDITLRNCSLLTDVSTTSSLAEGVIVSGSNTSYTTGASGVSNITLEDNYILGGYNGIRFNGNFGNEVQNVTIEGNHLDDPYYYGIYLLRNDGVTIENNAVDVRSTGTDFSAGIYFSSTDDYQIIGNTLRGMGRYGIYNTNGGGTSTSRAAIVNNAIGGGFRSNSTLTSGIRILNTSSQYIDIIHNSINVDQPSGRGLNVSNTSPSNLRIWNNNLAHTPGSGTGYALYVSSTNSIEDIDYNNYYSDGSNFVYYGSARADLATLQGVNTPANNDANSVSADPLFLAFDHLLPLSNAIDNEGLGIPQIPIDIEGNPRDPNNPSIGAYEFTAPNGDVSLDEVRLSASECLGSNDSIYFEVSNNLGSTINFGNDPLNFTWQVTGPVNSTGTVTVSSGSLAVGNSAEFGGDGVDMSVPGNYVISLAYIDTNAVNDVVANDTLMNTFNVDVDPLLAVSPKIDTVNVIGDSVDLTAQSPFFPGGDFFFTEVCHYNGFGTGGNSAAWLVADDYVEITGVPNSDLDGYTLEQWNTSSLQSTHTFPSGTVLGPNGTAVIAVGQLGSSTPDPQNYYYHGNGSYTSSFSSGGSAGRILLDPAGSIIDAVGYSGFSGYTFPAASNVTASDWSGNTGSTSGTAGMRLEGADVNSVTNWSVVTSANPQDANVVNTNVTVPAPASLTGFSWNFQSAVIDTNVETTVGPFTVPGIYEYIAEYTGTPCGTLYDTATVVVLFTDIDVVAANDPSCNQGTDGQIEVTSLGGQAPFTYAWSDDPNRTGNTASGLVAGTYGVTVTDANNVSDSTTITLTNPAQFPLSFNMTPSSCGNADGQLDVSINGGSSPYTYAWSSGGSAALETGLTGGSQYTVTVTDANGCVSIDSANVSDAGAPALTFNIVNDIDCATDTDGEVAVSVSGGALPYSYNWSNSSTNATLSNVAGGNYSVTVTDSLGCSVVGTVSLNDPDTLEITSATVNNVTCNGSANGSIQIAVAGGTLPYSYNWSNNSNSPSISGLAPGSYSGTVTDANGCQVVGGPVTVSQPAAPLTASVTSTTNVSCNGGNDGEGTVAAAGGTAPYTYTWSNAGTGATQTGLSAGSYIVTITDDNNCQTLQSVNISQPSALQSVILSSQDVSCNGGSDGTATAVAQGGTSPYTYAWSNASTGAMAMGLSQGSYDVTVTDDNGCTSISSVVIGEPSALTASISNTTDVTCFGANNGTATVTATGGTPGYTYAWSNNQGNPTATGLGAGSYDVTVTDANGCNTIVSTTITEPTALSASLSATHVGCNGGSDGELEAVVSGGTSPYSYNWSNGDTNATADSLTAGLYLVTVSDANGCNTILSNFVNEPSALTTSLSITSEITCNGETDGEVMVNVQGGTSPYSFAWSNSDSTMNASNLGAGMVHVTVTDANGCMIEDSVSLSEPDVLAVSIENDEDATCFGYANGSGEAIVQGGTMPYSYSWTTGTQTATANNLPAGINEITVTDANGCMATGTVEIEEPAQIDTSLVVENNGALIANAAGSDVTYQWWDCEAEEIVAGASGQYFEPADNGNFALIINEAGCQDTSACFELTRVSAGDLAGETNTFEVYPNPNRGQFNVRITGNSEEPVQLDVMDMQGKQLLSKNIGRLSGELVEELNINLAAGVYFVKVIRDGEMSIKRVVVQ